MTGLGVIRKRLNVPVYRGMRVRVEKGQGVITQGDGYSKVRIRMDGEKLGSIYYVSEILEYFPDSMKKQETP